MILTRFILLVVGDPGQCHVLLTTCLILLLATGPGHCLILLLATGPGHCSVLLTTSVILFVASDPCHCSVLMSTARLILLVIGHWSVNDPSDSVSHWSLLC